MMREQENLPVEQVIRKARSKSLRRRVLALLSVFVLMVTTNQMIFVADTLEHVAACGMEEHTHSESCYDDDGKLTCELSEHEHTDACYQQRPKTDEDVVVAEAVSDEAFEELDAFELEDDGSEAETELENASLDETEDLGYRYAVGAQNPVYLHEILEAVGLPADGSVEVGQVVDEAHPEGMIRIENSDAGVAIYPMQAFSDVELAVFEGEDIYTVTLRDAVMPEVEESVTETVEAEEETVETEEETAEAEGVEAEIVTEEDENSDPALETEPVEEEQTLVGEDAAPQEQTEVVIDENSNENEPAFDEIEPEPVDAPVNAPEAGEAAEQVTDTDDTTANETTEDETTEDETAEQEETAPADEAVTNPDPAEQEEDAAEAQEEAGVAPAEETDAEEPADGTENEAAEADEAQAADEEADDADAADDADEEAIEDTIKKTFEAAFDLTDADAPFSLVAWVSAAMGGEAETESPVELWTVTCDEEVLTVEATEGDWSVTPLRDFEETALTVDTGDAVCELTLTNGSVPAEEEVELEAAEAVVYTAEIDLTGAEAPYSLAGWMAQARPEDAEDETAPADEWTLEYDAEVFTVEAAEGDYSVTPVKDFEQAVFAVETGDARYELSLLNRAEAPEYLTGEVAVDVEGAGYTLLIDVPEAAKLPATATFRAVALNDSTYDEAALAAVADDDSYKVLATFDLTIYDDGEVIQPEDGVALGVSVDFGDALAADTQVYAVHFPGTGAQPEEAIEEELVLSAQAVRQPMRAKRSTVMLEDQGLEIETEEVGAEIPGTQLIDAENDGNGVASFQADSFSVYTIVGSKVSVDFLTANGKTLKITLTFSDEEVLPEGAKLEVSELLKEEDGWMDRSLRLGEVLQEKYGYVVISDTRFLDIKIKVGEEEFEPKEPVEVRIEYTEEFDTEYTYDYVNPELKPEEVELGEKHFVMVHYVDDSADVLESQVTEGSGCIMESVSQTTSFSKYDIAYFTVDKIDDVDRSGSLPSLIIPGKSASGARTLGATKAAGATPSHSKSLVNNNDGTYDIHLNVTGEANTTSEVSSVNVIVVYDTSTSMSNSHNYDPYWVYTYVENTTGRYGTDGNGNFFTLYRRSGGSYTQLNNDTYSGTVYRNNQGTEYKGIRYIRRRTNRADVAEPVVRSFITSLYDYQNSDDPSNIQTTFITFNNSATPRTNWTTNAGEITSYLKGNGNANSYNQTAGFYDSGTNWEKALQAVETALSNMPDNDPTYVVFITDGAPTTSTFITTAGTQYEECYTHARDEALRIQQAVNATGGDFYSIYAYGDETDWLATMMYYANNGVEPSSGRGTSFNTKGYYKASDTSALASAISDIFDDIVDTLGISSVSITDGTTSEVELSTGGSETAHLLDVNADSFRYSLSWNVNTKADGTYGFTMPDKATGDNVAYTVSVEGKNVTITWEGGSASYTGKVESGKLTIDWTGATPFYNVAPPDAVFEDPDVKWDLKKVGTLLNGVTYDVAFECWPSQYTLDTIADLKNGKTTYNRLDANIQEYLEKNGDEYKLKTNTSAILTYTDTRIENARPQTTEYVNPNPVETSAVEALAISKKWENALDSRPVQSINLEVTRDGKERYEVVLSKDNDWENSAHVSIGIMTVHDGVVTVKTTGHDFSFAEPEDLTYHWELDVPVVHPMKINGTDYVLLLVKDDDIPDAVKALTAPATMTVGGVEYYKMNYKGEDKCYKVDSQNAALTAINRRRSTLDITKVVNGDNPPADAMFDFVVKVKDPNDEDVWFSVQDTDETFVTNQAVFSGATPEIINGIPTGSYSATSNSEIKLKLKVGWNLRFFNLATGTTYEATEDTSTLARDYSFDSVVGQRKYYETGEDEQTVEITEPTGTVTEEKIEGVIEKMNSKYAITFTNEYSPVTQKVKIRKIGSDAPNGLAGAKFTLDSISVTLVSREEDGYLPNGSSSTVFELPVDQTYTLTETDAPTGYVGVDAFNINVAQNGVTVSKASGVGAPENVTVSGPDSVGVYTVTVMDPKKLSITVKKKWLLTLDDNTAPVVVQLMRKKYEVTGSPVGEEAVGESFVLKKDSDEDVNWKKVFDNLPASEIVDGVQYNYRYYIQELGLSFDGTTGDPKALSEYGLTAKYWAVTGSESEMPQNGWNELHAQPYADQPNGYLVNSGTLLVYNRDDGVGYQMDVRKKWKGLGEKDGEGKYGWADIYEREDIKTMRIALTMYRNVTLDNGTVLEPQTIGHLLLNGTSIITNTTGLTFVYEMDTSNHAWHLCIRETGVGNDGIRQLPKQGIIYYNGEYRKATFTYTMRETGIMDAQENNTWDEWYSGYSEKAEDGKMQVWLYNCDRTDYTIVKHWEEPFEKELTKSIKALYFKVERQWREHTTDIAKEMYDYFNDSEVSDAAGRYGLTKDQVLKIGEGDSAVYVVKMTPAGSDGSWDQDQELTIEYLYSSMNGFQFAADGAAVDGWDEAHYKATEVYYDNAAGEMRPIEELCTPTYERKIRDYDGDWQSEGTNPPSLQLGKAKETRVRVTNKTPSYEVVIKKTNPDGTALPGAKFNLYGKDYLDDEGNVNEEAEALQRNLISGDDGLIDLGKLREGVYYLVETEPPKGFNKLQGPVVITVNPLSTFTKEVETADGQVTYPLYVTYALKDSYVSVSNDGITVTETTKDGVTTYAYELRVSNQPGVKLPETGGVGAVPFTVGGLSLMGIALFLLMKRRMRAE